jgi:hypothetical protein
MTPEELKYLDDRFTSQKELIELLIGNTNIRLDDIIKQNEIRNHRIEKTEEDVIEVKENIHDIQKGCAFVQEKKAEERAADAHRKIKRGEWQRWLTIVLISMLGIYITWFYKRESNKVPVELFFEKTDSTLHVPRMYFRDEKTGSLREVHMDYFDINEN